MRYLTPGEDQIETQIALLSHGFGATLEQERDFHTAIGADQHRIVMADAGHGRERLVASGSFVPFGLIIGGREVPVWGLSGVAVDPFTRSRGQGRFWPTLPTWLTR